MLAKALSLITLPIIERLLQILVTMEFNLVTSFRSAYSSLRDV